jgi:hypothetical protein
MTNVADLTISRRSLGLAFSVCTKRSGDGPASESDVPVVATGIVSTVVFSDGASSIESLAIMHVLHGYGNRLIAAINSVVE